MVFDEEVELLNMRVLLLSVAVTITVLPSRPWRDDHAMYFF